MRQCNKQIIFPLTNIGTRYYAYQTLVAIEKQQANPIALAEVIGILHDLRLRAARAKPMCNNCYEFISRHIDFYAQLQEKLERIRDAPPM